MDDAHNNVYEQQNLTSNYNILLNIIFLMLLSFNLD